MMSSFEHLAPSPEKESSNEKVERILGKAAEAINRRTRSIVTKFNTLRSSFSPEKKAALLKQVDKITTVAATLFAVTGGGKMLIDVAQGANPEVALPLLCLRWVL